MRNEYTSLKAWRAAAKARGLVVRASCNGYKAMRPSNRPGAPVVGRYFIGGYLR